MVRVFNFSGGKTSAFMTIKYYKPGDLVVFCDTGREHPKTYKFINDFEAFEGIPVIRISYMNTNHPFDIMLYKKKYKIIPNRVKRICTDVLKIKTCKAYLRGVGIREYENYIGFRADESKRVLKRKQESKKVHDKFPLFEDGINKQHVDQYWSSKPYTLEIPSILGNCTLCFMKGKNAIMAILSVYPELADEWINDEEMSEKLYPNNGHTYFQGCTIKQLRDMAQNNLFQDYHESLAELRPAFDCACTT
jgi:hypothetical protein